MTFSPDCDFCLPWSLFPGGSRLLIRLTTSMLAFVLLGLVQVGASESASKFSAQDIEFFEKKVRPLLVEHCYECHSQSSKKLEGGLRLDSRAAVLVGGDTGAAVVPSHPEQSLLIGAINYGDLYEMPPKYRLPPEAIETLFEWVKRGLPWPDEKMSASATAPKEFNLQRRKSSHWAWQQLRDPTLPEVGDKSWPLDPLDRFVLAKLEKNNLKPAMPADPRVLVRRVYFDLIGLPPSPEQVEAFARDPSQQALAAVIDKLLAAPQFGERWARHWLDLMRYAESRGHEFDYSIPNAWQYRDYVIRAMNADVPYDQFVTEHLAGDLLEDPRRHPSKGFNESVLATGFWYLGEWVHSPVDVRQDEVDRFDNAIDVFGKAFLGLTVACARCHDHKFDAISQADYYALACFLQSSAYRQVRFETSAHNRDVARQLDLLRGETGRRLAVLVAQDCKGRLPGLESLLLAAADALASGSDIQLASGERSKNESAGIAQPNKLLSEIADQHGLSVDELLPWIDELFAARTDPAHPLHLLALTATEGLALTATEGTQAVNNRPSKIVYGEIVLPESAQIVIDFQSENARWLTDGPAFGSRAVQRGEVLPGLDASAPIAEIVQHGRAELDRSLADLKLTKGTEDNPVAGGAWKERPGKILSTPTVELRGGKLFYLLRGGTCVHAVVDSHRIIHGPLHGSMRKEIETGGELRWVEHDLSDYRRHGVHVEFGPKDDLPLQILMVVEGDTLPLLPKDWPVGFITQELAAAPHLAEITKRCTQWIGEAVTRMESDDLASSDLHTTWAQWVVDNPQLWANDSHDVIARVLADYHGRREELLKLIRKESMTAPAIWDIDGEDEFLLVRGNPRTPAKLVPRGMLTAIAGEHQTAINDGSGRLELARRLLDPNNPFPARVMANRVWQHLTGRGIVASVDNFGVLGQAPTHPGLLDHLATRFIEQGWSVKQLIRAVMLSRTYQMSSQYDAYAAESDPQNLLCHRMLPRRIEAEVIRDTMLALAGQLDSQAFGASVPVHLTEFMQGRGRPKKSGPLDGEGRRSIYVSVRRNFLSPMMLAFDTPQPARSVGLRTVSNVPAQALILMNNPFVIEQAGHFARRLLARDLGTEERIERLYEEMFSRFPREEELVAAKQFLLKQAREYGLSEAAGWVDEAVWTDLCHAMFNVKEFIFIR